VKLLSTHYHEAVTSLEGRIEKRIAARGIIFQGDLILLMYTSRYNDYSLPGGGVDENESIAEGLVRELKEETGARNIKVEEGMGIYEEFRPARTPGYDILHMVSYIFKIACDEEFDLPKFESYEVKNGMKTVWMDINEAIGHNRKVIERLEPSMGLSVKRELFLLESIRQQYVICEK
jgi:ADP-ribose pyrophosphatase YjhB (NUDIX family)